MDKKDIVREIARLKKRMSMIKDKKSPAYMSMQKKMSELQMNISRQEAGLPTAEEQAKRDQEEKEWAEINEARKAQKNKNKDKD